MQSVGKVSLLAVSVFGILLYGFFLAATFADKTWIEKVGTEYIDYQVRGRVNQTVDAIEPPSGDSLLKNAARELFERNEAKIELYKVALKEEIATKLLDALAEIRDVSCECRQFLEETAADFLNVSIADLTAANARITSFIHSSYASVIRDLQRDFRIFAGSNLAAFLILLAILLAKSRAAVHLMLPGAMLALSALLCSYFYLFEQNWFMTIVHGDYVGFAYLAWLGVVFLFLLDIVMNRGRITGQVISSIFDAFGSAFSVAPC
ncbi:MAG: hypothetical protein AAFN07_07645 [Pseudomonadota bacterium]